jgi:membrane protein implicated in regulation of membrane protease activity
MTESGLGFNALTVFLVATVAGFLFLLASFFLGDLFEQLGWDVDLGTDGMHEMGWFDSRVLSIFVTAFGGFGAIGVLLGLGVFISSLFGLTGGMALAVAVLWFGRLLFRQQASSSVSAYQLIGRIAEVTVAIPPSGVGQIRCRVGAERVEKLARSRSAEIIAMGAKVVIEEIAEEMVIVSIDEEINRLLFPENS